MQPIFNLNANELHLNGRARAYIKYFAEIGSVCLGWYLYFYRLSCAHSVRAILDRGECQLERPQNNGR